MNVLHKKIIFVLYLLLGQSVLVAMESKPNLILGLNDVLVHEKSENITELHTFFTQKSFLVKDYKGCHYIVPAYLPEFLRFARAKFNLAFFSDCSDQRVRSIVKDIWLNIFQSELPECVPILSKGDLTYAADNLKLQPEDILFYGSKVGLSLYKDYKKDITKVGVLQNTILVDSDVSWVLRGQVRNFLHVPSSKLLWFKEIIGLGKTSCDYDRYFAQKSTEACKVIGFYKLLYSTGLLDQASEHESGMIAGLHDIQFKHKLDKAPVIKNSKCMLDLAHYKRGYKVLAHYAEGRLQSYYPELEKLFQD